MKAVLQICSVMADGELLAGTCEAKVSVKILASSQVYESCQRVLTVGGAMPGFQVVSRVVFATDCSQMACGAGGKTSKVAAMYGDQPVTAHWSR